MCTRRLISLASLCALVATLTACSGPDRTGTAFCAQLGKELPAIAEPIATSGDVSAMVDRYERLLKRAPLTIEADFTTLTNLLKQAARVNPNNATQVQELADASYRANQSSLSVRDWIKSTCAVDISTGLNIEPMRQATTSTTAPTTTTPAPTTVPAPTAPETTPAPIATTVPPVATTAG